MADIPDKPFYKIGEVCHYTDTQPYVLRFWESEFPGLAPEKNRSGQRMYTRRDIDLVLKIKQLLYEEEFTIAGARKKLEQEEAAAAAGEGASVPSRAPVEVVREPVRSSEAPPRGDEEAAQVPPFRPEAPPAAAPTPAERAKAAVAQTEILALRKRIAELEGRHASIAAALEASEARRRQDRERRERVAAKLEALLRAIGGGRDSETRDADGA